MTFLNVCESRLDINVTLQVHPGQPHEPGWLGGELNGKVGWFPEAYVELADAATSDAAAATLQPIGKICGYLKFAMVSCIFFLGTKNS